MSGTDLNWHIRHSRCYYQTNNNENDMTLVERNLKGRMDMTAGECSVRMSLHDGRRRQIGAPAAGQGTADTLPDIFAN